MSGNYLVNSSEAHTLQEKRASYHTFDAKSPEVQRLINQALQILDSFGVPIDEKTPRRLERMALVFLALCDVNKGTSWAEAKSLADNYSLKTRDIIAYINKEFGETISRGSYDDIRRKDMKHPTMAGVIISSLPKSARNDPKRAWAISPEYIALIRAFGTGEWNSLVADFYSNRTKLHEKLLASRTIPKIPITLPSGDKLDFGLGEHNQLQKAIIEEFLPRYGFGAHVIYVGDAENKFLHYDVEVASELGLATLSHAELPDIIAYSAEKEWLYLIEAVHSSGPMSAERMIALEPFLLNCTVNVIYMSAFLDRTTFRKFVADIGWETEVWIATDPDHVIHFNGEKFLGPYLNGQ